MTSRLPRTTFNRSGLVRILSETLPEPLDPNYDFGERLGQWLDFSDALALFSALNSRAGAPSTVPGKSDSAARPLYDQLSRVRQNLTESIIHDGVFSSEAAASDSLSRCRKPRRKVPRIMRTITATTWRTSVT